MVYLLTCLLFIFFFCFSFLQHFACVFFFSFLYQFSILMNEGHCEPNRRTGFKISQCIYASLVNCKAHLVSIISIHFQPISNIFYFKFLYLQIKKNVDIYKNNSFWHRMERARNQKKNIHNTRTNPINCQPSN